MSNTAKTAGLRRNIGLFYLFSLVTNAHFQRGIFVLFLLEQGFSNTQIGLLQALLFAVNFLSEVPTGFLGDRWGRRASIGIGLGLAALNGWAQLAFGGFWMFAALFAVKGLSQAFLSGSDRALLYDSLIALGREHDHVKIRGRMQLISGVSLAIAMAIGGWMQGVSWSLVYGAYAGFMALGAVVVACMVEAPYLPEETEESGPPATVRGFFSSGIGRALIPLMLASGFLHAMITPYFVFSQNVFEAKGVALTWIAIIYAGVQVLSGLFALVAERVQNRVALAVVFPATALLVGACAALTSLAGPVLAVTLFVFAMVLPEVAVLLVDHHMQERIPSNIRASVLSTFSLVEACFTSVSYLFGGMLLDLWSPNRGLIGLAPLAVLSITCSAAYFKHKKPVPAAQFPQSVLCE